MPSRTRATLKTFFEAGKRPSQDHFVDLIDSMLNMNDEGFRKTVANGNEISASTGHEALISFFNDQAPEVPAWSIALGTDGATLKFNRGASTRARPSPDADAEEGTRPPVLCFHDQGRQPPHVGIGTESPQASLDVEGDLRSRGRRGSFPAAPHVELEADGEWKDLTGDLEGCQALEVVAGTGRPGSERFALVHAVALNAYNPTFGLFDFLNRRRGIRATHAYYSRRCDRLELRWFAKNAPVSGKNVQYRLQVRTGCNYGKEEGGKPFIIQAHVTQLWFDPHMRGSVP